MSDHFRLLSVISPVREIVILLMWGDGATLVLVLVLAAILMLVLVGVGVIIAKLPVLLGPSSSSSCSCRCQGPSLVLSRWVMGPCWYCQSSSSWWHWWDHRCHHASADVGICDHRSVGAGGAGCHCAAVLVLSEAIIFVMQMVVMAIDTCIVLVLKAQWRTQARSD